MTFSKQFGFLEAGEDRNGTLHHIRVAGDSASWVGQNPWIYEVLEYTIFPIFGNPFALANRNGAVREFAVAQCQIRQDQGAAAQSDIIQKLLRVHEKKPTEFDDDAVRSMAATNVFGGAETTTSSIRAAIYFLLKHRPTLTKLQDEIDRTCKESEWPIGDPISLYLADSMPYLHAVLYESMRLFPANGLPLARVSPPEGLEIDGHFFPPGTQVTVYSWSLHRNKDIFGEDAEQFRPERWLEEKKSQELHRYFFSFGCGARSCLGRHLAWMEMLKILSTIFRRYDIELADPDAHWRVGGGFIKSQEDVNVVLRPRSI